MLLKRMFEHPNRSFFLFGVRGSGKSVWVRQALPDATYIDLLEESRYIELAANPGLFSQLIQANDHQDWIVVDEIQRLPSLLNEVHRLISASNLKFALLGSSARKLKTQASNLLAGRASQRFMYPFSPEELGSDFKLEHVLRYGSLPVVWAAEDREDVLRSYVNLYLREEIRMEALIRNLPGFARFLPIAALFHGQSINSTAIARDAHVAASTVKGFIDVLEDTFIATRLSGFEARLRVRERTHPKLYFVDPGLVRALKAQFGSVTNEERGALFEGWIFTLLQTYRDTRGLFERIHYWQPVNSRTEVDFVLLRGADCVAIEANSAKTYNTRLLTGLRAIANLPGLRRRVLVYGGEEDYRTDDGIEVWSVRRFVDALEADQVWL